MKIENYKGIEIFHNAEKDEFYTQVVIRKSSNGKKDEFISNSRLQRTRDEIDKFLNVAAKKPVLKSAWLRSDNRYDGDTFEKVEIILHNSISGATQIRKADGRMETMKKPYYDSDKKLFICCKENDAIVSNLNKQSKEIEKLRKAGSCSGGKLIPLKDEHFK